MKKKEKLQGKTGALLTANQVIYGLCPMTMHGSQTKNSDTVHSTPNCHPLAMNTQKLIPPAEECSRYKDSKHLYTQQELWL